MTDQIKQDTLAQRVARLLDPANAGGSAFRDATPKQRLLLLRDAGHVNDLQVSALARIYDAEVGTLGPDRAFDKAISKVDSGRLELRTSAGTRARAPHVFEAPKDESLKQTLVWLKQQGALSQVQMQQAAAVLDKMGDKIENATTETLAVVLYELGARTALPEGWTPIGSATEDTEDLLERDDFAPNPILVSPEDALRARLRAANVPEAQIEEAVARSNELVETLLGRVHRGAAEIAGRISTAAPELGPQVAGGPVETSVAPNPDAEVQGGYIGSSGREGEQPSDDPDAAREGDDAPVAMTELERLEKNGLTRERYYERRAPEVLVLIETVHEPATLDRIREWETAHPRYEGGRGGVLTALENRSGELLAQGLENEE